MRIERSSTIPVALAASLLLMMPSAQRGDAQLTSLDSSFGADTITLDTATDIRWLDVTLSTPFSYQQVLPELAPAGLFSGYRLATQAEVTTLWQHAGIDVSQLGVFVPQNLAPIQYLMGFVGITGTDGNLGGGNFFDFTAGHIFSEPFVLEGRTWVNVGTIAADPDPTETGRASFGFVPIDNPNSEHGSWLVERVPQPLILFFIGFVSQVPSDVASAFAIGDPASGVIVIDLSTPDTDPAVERGEYVGAPSDLAYDFGLYSASSPGGGVGDSVAVRNLDFLDDYRVNAVAVSGATVNGFVPTNLTLELFDNSASVFDATTLPADLDLGAFDLALAAIIFQQVGAPSPNVQATITSLTATDLSDPADIVADFDRWVAEGAVTPTSGPIRRLRALRARLLVGATTGNCGVLVSILRRVDGLGPPVSPVDVATGEGLPALLAVIEGLLDLNGCL